MRVYNRCLICGKPVPSKYRAYCDEHRAYAKADDKAIEDAPTELLFALIMAIFERAREDYLTNVDGKRSDAERFFRSEWAQELSLSTFDPDEVLIQMDEEIEYGLNES